MDRKIIMEGARKCRWGMWKRTTALSCMRWKASNVEKPIILLSHSAPNSNILSTFLNGKEEIYRHSWGHDRNMCNYTPKRTRPLVYLCTVLLEPRYHLMCTRFLHKIYKLKDERVNRSKSSHSLMGLREKSLILMRRPCFFRCLLFN